jgi:ArsR family transcriptional regulator, arsenate/arsenite/antimonite-responsive transcriptional repressor
MATLAAPPLDVRPVARLLKAVADGTRLRIVALLCQGELCVCHLQAALALSQPNVSRHLAILRAAGVVEARRDGGWVHYRLAPQSDRDCERQLQALVASFSRQPALRRNVARVMKACGPKA